MGFPDIIGLQGMINNVNTDVDPCPGLVLDPGTYNLGTQGAPIQLDTFWAMPFFVTSAGAIACSVSPWQS